MADRPIIFGAESVRAILAGRKTQTRSARRTRSRRSAEARVAELEKLLAPWGLLVEGRVERLTLGGVDREHERDENRAMDAVRAEAVEIARARRTSWSPEGAT